MNLCQTCANSWHGAKKICGKCERVVYCSKECQRQDWKGHKKHCVSAARPHRQHPELTKAEDLLETYLAQPEAPEAVFFAKMLKKTKKLNSSRLPLTLDKVERFEQWQGGYKMRRNPMTLLPGVYSIFGHLMSSIIQNIAIQIDTTRAILYAERFAKIFTKFDTRGWLFKRASTSPFEGMVFVTSIHRGLGLGTPWTMQFCRWEVEGIGGDVDSKEKLDDAFKRLVCRSDTTFFTVSLPTMKIIAEHGEAPPDDLQIQLPHRPSSKSGRSAS